MGREGGVRKLREGDDDDRVVVEGERGEVLVVRCGAVFSCRSSVVIWEIIEFELTFQ